MARLDLRCKVTSQGHKHLHKYCLQNNTSTNSLLLTIGPAHRHSAANGWHLIKLNRSVASKQIEITIPAAILSTLDTVYRCAFTFWQKHLLKDEAVLTAAASHIISKWFHNAFSGNDHFILIMLSKHSHATARGCWYGFLCNDVSQS